MADNNVAVPEKVITRVIDVAGSDDVPSEERVAAIDLVRKTGAEDGLERAMKTIERFESLDESEAAVEQAGSARAARP